MSVTKNLICECDMISVYAIYNEKQKILADYFATSMQQHPNFSLEMFACQEEEDREMVGFKKYHRIVDFKLKQIVRTLRENEGKRILWCDVDVQILRDPTDELNRVMTDLRAMHDNQMQTVVNGGFLYIHANHRTIDFWQLMIKDQRKQSFDLYEQDMMNTLLREKQSISVSFLPRTFWCNHLPRPPEPIIVHHATTDHHAHYPNGIVNEKLKLLKTIRWKNNYSFFN